MRKLPERWVLPDAYGNVLDIFKNWITTANDLKQFNLLDAPKRILIDDDKPLPIITGIIDKTLNLEKIMGSRISVGINMPDFSNNFAWIAPIRSKPKRTYDQYKFSFSPEGEHAPYLIRKYLGSSQNSRDGQNFKKFAIEYGKKGGLLAGLNVKKYGKSPSSPFELDVQLEEGSPINISNVGYGISQSLPIIVEIFARASNSWFSIQQPEVHLHPRAQAALGDVFFQLASNQNKNFFIETHSDFLIDRFRINLRKSKIKVESQVLFFERKNGFNTIEPIAINIDGKYSDSQPESFRQFFIKEELSLLGIR